MQCPHCDAEYVVCFGCGHAVLEYNMVGSLCPGCAETSCDPDAGDEAYCVGSDVSSVICPKCDEELLL
jgi:hypothetical protein